jgi:hypothetical protein
MTITKNFIKVSAIVGVLAICLALFSFRNTKDAEFAGGSLYRPAVISGAILNTENDTIVLPNFASNYQFEAATLRTSVSGTHNVKMYLQEAVHPTGTTTWRNIDSTSTTTATLAFIRQPVTYGYRHRLILDGTGTQSSTYTVAIIAKPLN